MKLCHLILLLLPAFFGRAKDPPIPADLPWKYSFGFRLGWDQLTLLDRNASSLLYQGNLPAIGLDWDALSEKSILSLRFQAARGSFFAQDYRDRQVVFLQEDIYGHIDTISVPMRGTSTLGRFSLAWLRSFQVQPSWRFSIGGVLSDEAYYQEGFVTPGLMNVASIGPALQFDYRSEQKFSASLQVRIPAIALVSRSAYHNSVSMPNSGKAEGFFAQGTQLESLNRHRQLSLSAALHRRLGERWRAGLAYEFDWVKNSLPRPLALSRHQLSLSFQYTY